MTNNPGQTGDLLGGSDSCGSRFFFNKRCISCGVPTDISSNNEAELLLTIFRDELNWHNQRAVNFGNRSTFWLGLIFAGIGIIVRQNLTALSKDFNDFQSFALMLAALSLGVSIFGFWKTVGTKTVVSADSSLLRGFVNSYFEHKNIRCGKCFAMNEFLTADDAFSQSILESASKEADDRGDSYYIGMNFLALTGILLTLVPLLGLLN